MHDLEFPNPVYDHQLSQKTIQLNGRKISNLDEFLQQGLSGPIVAGLADEAVSVYGNAALKHVNNALNTWNSTWHRRRHRELDREERSFSQNPFPFWWLAKLYLLLHICGGVLPRSSEFATHRATGIHGVSKLQTQAKIIKWFLKFRTPQFHAEPLASNIFSKLVRAAEPAIDKC